MRREHLIAIALLGVLYLWGLAPSVHVHDAGELTAGAWTLGVAHPPGAPLYMLVAKLFTTLVPWGHIAWRANLLSAVCALATVLILIFWTQRRTGSRWHAMAAGILLALAPVFWSQALMAEVYTLQALLLVVVIVSLDLGWRPEATAMCWGLLLACHIGLAPLTPVVLVLLTLPVPGARARQRTLLTASAALALPLALYLYLPLRSLADPAIDWGNPETLERLWWHLSNRNVRGRMFSLPIAAYVERTMDYGLILIRNLLFGLPAGLAVLLTPARRAPAAILCTLVILYDAAFVVLLDTAPLGSEAYTLPAVVAAAALIALASPHLHRWRWRAAVPIVVLLSALTNAAIHAREVMLHDSFVVRDSVENLLDQVPPGAVLLTQEDNTTFPLAYVVAAEGARPDLVIYDRAGNLFRSPYDRPLFTVEDDLAEYRRRIEDPWVASLLNSHREVWYATPFIEFRPASWRIDHRGTVGRACPGPAPHPRHQSSTVPGLRRPARPDWMSRQVLAMDGIKRAAASPGRARDLLDEALELAEIAELELRIAQLAIAHGHLDLARRAAARACDRSPLLAPAWSVRGHGALLAGDRDAAESFAKTAIDLDPALPQPHATLGLVAVERGDPAAAEAFFSSAVDLGAAGPEVFVNRGLVRRRLGRLDEAIGDLDRALDHQRHCGEICVIRLEWIVESGTTRERLATEVCRACELGFDPDPDDRFLVRFLTVAARSGYPGCVENRLAPYEGRSASTDQVISAYRRAQQR